MAVTVAGSPTLAEAATATTITCDVPAGVTTGEVLVAVVTHSPASSIAVPDQTGWTTIGKATLSSDATAMFYKVVTGTEPANYTFTGLSSGRCTAEMVRLAGVDTSVVLDAPAKTATATGTAVTLASITTVTNYAMVLYDASRQTASAGDITPATGTTLLINTTGVGRRTLLCCEPWNTAGATGTRTFTATDGTSLGNAAVSAAFRPASATPPAGSIPTVSAGADATATTGVAFTRTATETTDSTILSRAWTIVSGPSGAGSTIGTAAALSWTPTVAGSYVLRYSATNATGTGTDDVTVTVSSSGPPDPVLVHRIVGIPDGTVARIAVKTTNATSVRLKVGTDTAVSTGVIFGSAGTPDTNGHTQLTVTGLTAGTRYYYRVAMTNTAGEQLDTSSTVGTFRTAPSGQTSFSFGFGSCTNAADSAALAASAARADDLFFHLGDLYYADGSGSTAANVRAQQLARIGATNHQAVFATRATGYTPSDHDGMNNTSTAGSDPTAWTSFNSVYRELWPTPTLPGGTTGVYYTFAWGRVRFVVWDTRSFATIASATDNASKTRLGTTQKAWVKSTITAASEQVVVIVNADPWVGPTTAGEDKWYGYTTERSELATYFAGTGKKIVMLGGDAHMLGADDGTNAPGGITVLQASPLGNTASVKGGPYSAGTYPATSTGAFVEQYGRVVVTDSGDSIALAFTGYSADNTARISLTTTRSVAAPATRLLERWSGSALATQAVERWSGSALAPQLRET